jgi:hypothetical protein
VANTREPKHHPADCIGWGEGGEALGIYYYHRRDCAEKTIYALEKSQGDACDHLYISSVGAWGDLPRLAPLPLHPGTGRGDADLEWILAAIVRGKLQRACRETRGKQYPNQDFRRGLGRSHKGSAGALVSYTGMASNMACEGASRLRAHSRRVRGPGTASQPLTSRQGRTAEGAPKNGQSSRHCILVFRSMTCSPACQPGR